MGRLQDQTQTLPGIVDMCIASTTIAEKWKTNHQEYKGSLLVHAKTCNSFGGPSMHPPSKSRMSLDTIKIKLYFYGKKSLSKDKE